MGNLLGPPLVGGNSVVALLNGDEIFPAMLEAIRGARRSDAGAQIAGYPPTAYQCKVMIVDGAWVSAGSTNFDNRSFRLNDEANLSVLDAGFAAALTGTFERDLAVSRAVSLEEWRRRPWREKLLENALALFRSQI